MKAAALEESRAEWFEDALATIRTLASEQDEISADDLRRELRPPASDKWPGLVFGLAARKGLIEKVKEGTSKAKSRNCGALKIWAAVKEEQR